jgi:hypothetical protein
MLEGTRIRCPACRTTVPLAVLWAAGDVCPGCSRPLIAARRRPGPTGVLGKTLELLHPQESGSPRPGSRALP